MPSPKKVTTAKQADTLPNGKYSTNTKRLYLVVRGGSRSWRYRYTASGKAHEISIGVLPGVTFKKAAEIATEFNLRISRGQAPNIKNAAQVTPTFTSAAAQYIRAHRRSWANRKHAQQWVRTLKTYARPIIGGTRVDQITTEDILTTLKPIWHSKTETAKRTQGRIERVLDYAAARKWKGQSNPARWKGHLDTLLPKPTSVKPVQHHPAMPYEEIPYFFATLTDNTGVSSLALQFLILTAARTSEVLKAQWQEIDFENLTWTRPAAHMKLKKEHKVPLSATAQTILKSAPRIDGNNHIFPGAKAGKHLSNMALLKVMRSMGYGVNGALGSYVPHGFRSSFRDWSGETTSHPRDVCEMALAHAIENKVEAAYRRGSLFEKRRALMADWDEWCTGR